jgi:hypothetical protein
MITIPLLAATLALAPTGQKLSVETWATGQFTAAHSDFTGPARGPSVADMLGGGASGGFVLAFDPVIDDDAPPTLQAYLQRTGALSLSGGGSRFTYNYDHDFAPLDRTGGNATIGMDGYFGRTKSFYGGARFTFNYSDDHFRDRSTSVTTISFPIAVTLGVRFGDVRVRAEWQVSPQKVNDAGVQVAYWYNLSLWGYGVVRRKVEWTVGAIALEQGFGGELDAVVWLGRRLGLSAQLFASHERSSVSATTRELAGGTIGLTAWFTGRFGLRTFYSPEWISFHDGPNPNESRLAHTISLGVIGRPF